MHLNGVLSGRQKLSSELLSVIDVGELWRRVGPVVMMHSYKGFCVEKVANK